MKQVLRMAEENCKKILEPTDNAKEINITQNNKNGGQPSRQFALIPEESINESHAKGEDEIEPKGQVVAWVVDMSDPDRSEDRILNAHKMKQSEKILKKDTNNDSTENKSRRSIESNKAEITNLKFFIDLNATTSNAVENTKDSQIPHEKKNIFPMYVDLGLNTSVREMPALYSSCNSKKKNYNKSIKDVRNKLLCDSSEVNKTTGKSSTLGSFERYESLCNNVALSIPEIIAMPREEVLKKRFNSEQNNKVIVSDKKKTTAITIAPDVEGPNLEKDQISTNYVKLSDLDKDVIKAYGPIYHSEFDSVMTGSINERDSSFQAISTPVAMASSFHSENALSLNRLFPQLKEQFSQSMSELLPGRARLPLDTKLSFSYNEKYCLPEVMAISDWESSDNCCTLENNKSTEYYKQSSSLIKSCQSRLGQDLLRMFIEEIATDVIVECAGRRIKAHKCILSSRCQYFAGILSGGWVESAGNVIVIPSFEPNVIHFVLCHIYSGISVIPDSICIVELAAAADLLSMDSLKDAIMYSLKAKKCHHFHEPCPGCIAGVIECFSLTITYKLDDLHRKCLEWISRHFTKVWPTQSFATLPEELIEKCFQYQVYNFAQNTIIHTIYGCGVTMVALPNIRWAETIENLCKRLLYSAANFASKILYEVMSFILTMPWNDTFAARLPLEECIIDTIERAPVNITCRVYRLLYEDIKKSDQIRPKKQKTIFDFHGRRWCRAAEISLARQMSLLIYTDEFKELPIEYRKRLRQYEILNPSQTQPRTCAQIKRNREKYCYDIPKRLHNIDLEQVRAAFNPPKPLPTTRAKAVQPTPPPPSKIRINKAQEERTKYNLKRIQNQAGPSTSNMVRENKPFKPSTRPTKIGPPIVNQQDKINAAEKRIARKIPVKAKVSCATKPNPGRNTQSASTQSQHYHVSHKTGQRTSAIPGNVFSRGGKDLSLNPSTPGCSKGSTRYVKSDGKPNIPGPSKGNTKCTSVQPLLENLNGPGCSKGCTRYVKSYGKPNIPGPSKGNTKLTSVKSSEIYNGPGCSKRDTRCKTSLKPNDKLSSKSAANKPNKENDISKKTSPTNQDEQIVPDKNINPALCRSKTFQRDKNPKL
ncbi:uncharacterized protein [Battus philenor]|uniref:uncharacterized protein n=1 Tax=Battus philenor TaxID=42288 RepID=UPI0035D0E414